jgi:hypothetical protein
MSTKSIIFIIICGLIGFIIGSDFGVEFFSFYPIIGLLFGLWGGHSYQVSRF